MKSTTPTVTQVLSDGKIATSERSPPQVIVSDYLNSKRNHFDLEQQRIKLNTQQARRGSSHRQAMAVNSAHLFFSSKWGDGINEVPGEGYSSRPLTGAVQIIAENAENVYQNRKESPSSLNNLGSTNFVLSQDNE